MQNEVVMAYFEVLLQNLTAQTEETHEKLVRISRIWTKISVQELTYTKQVGYLLGHDNLLQFC
jgi:hypothetical protein